jgi:hypothetical protein
MLRFREYGPVLYDAPVGGAVVFSCSLLHEAIPVTSGRRFMFLPFLYDEAAKLIGQGNLRFLEPCLGLAVRPGWHASDSDSHSRYAGVPCRSAHGYALKGHPVQLYLAPDMSAPADGYFVLHELRDIRRN